MKKTELVGQIARATGYDRTTITNVLEATMTAIKKDVAEGKDIYLRGFGSFVTRVRAQKIARNITKSTSIVVPEHKIPAFKPSREFMEAVRKQVNKSQPLNN